jgi:hypothetical protein
MIAPPARVRSLRESLVAEQLHFARTCYNHAERQTSLEQPCFDIGKIGNRVFAKTPLLSARFLPLL